MKKKSDTDNIDFDSIIIEPRPPQCPICGADYSFFGDEEGGSYIPNCNCREEVINGL